MDTVMRKQTHSSSFLLNIYKYCLGKLVPLEIVYFYAVHSNSPAWPHSTWIFLEEPAEEGCPANIFQIKMAE